jgi:hypothetical protein
MGLRRRHGMMDAVDERRRRRLGGAIAALIILLVSAWVLLLSLAVSALGLLLVSGAVLSIVGLFVLPRAGAQPEGGGLSLTRRVAIGILGLLGVVAYLSSGFLLLLSLALSPNPGSDAPVLILKAVDIIGWLALGLWLLLDWSQYRLRGVVPPVGAWLWVFLLAAALGRLGYLAWGP